MIAVKGKIRLLHWVRVRENCHAIVFFLVLLLYPLFSPSLFNSGIFSFKYQRPWATQENGMQ